MEGYQLNGSTSQRADNVVNTKAQIECDSNEIGSLGYLTLNKESIERIALVFVY